MCLSKCSRNTSVFAHLLEPGCCCICCSSPSNDGFGGWEVLDISWFGDDFSNVQYHMRYYYLCVYDMICVCRIP